MEACENVRATQWIHCSHDKGISSRPRLLQVWDRSACEIEKIRRWWHSFQARFGCHDCHGSWSPKEADTRRRNTHRIAALAAKKKHDVEPFCVDISWHVSWGHNGFADWWFGGRSQGHLKSAGFCLLGNDHRPVCRNTPVAKAHRGLTRRDRRVHTITYH